MNPTEIFEIVRQVLVQELGVPSERVLPDADLRDELDLDSLDRVEFVMALEGRLGGCFDAESADLVATVQDVVDVVLAARQPTALAS